MLDPNFIHVTMVNKPDFKLYNINTEEEKQKFLQRMCEDSINSPIIQNEKAIGIITESKINETSDGITSFGVMWCRIGHEMMIKNNEFRFSATYLESI
jgi:predicted transcriptional regulator